MNGLLFINKEVGVTSRDVVNILCKKFDTKKIGHIGTLDPNASGVMVLCVGNCLKLVEILTDHDKEYIATVKVGVKTDSYDICGNVLDTSDKRVSMSELVSCLNSFKGDYLQTVPIYSSCKVNGKKLYDYARSGESVSLPSRMVSIYDINLIDFSMDSFSFRVSVSKGTYIRSLVNDIGEKLGVFMTLSSLNRTRLGNICLDDCVNINDCSINDLHDFKDYLDIPKVKTFGSFKRMIQNGVKIDNRNNIDDLVLFLDEDGKEIAIYKKNDKNELRAFKVF